MECGDIDQVVKLTAGRQVYLYIASLGLQDAAQWEKLVAEGIAYMRLTMDAEVRRNGPAFQGDPAH